MMLRGSNSEPFIWVMSYRLSIFLSVVALSHPWVDSAHAYTFGLFQSIPLPRGF